MKVINQEELERKDKLKALNNYKLSENYKALEAKITEKEDSTKATLISAYLTPSEEADSDGSFIFQEKKKYNHKNKFAWGIEVMSEVLEILDDSKGAELIKEKIQEGINNSEDHISKGLVKFFPGSGGVVEHRYTDIDFTESDRLIYKAQVWRDTIRVIDSLIEEYSKAKTEEEEISTEIEED